MGRLASRAEDVGAVSRPTAMNEHFVHVERTDHSASGSTYYAWCVACYWRSPHRKVEDTVREFAAAHERKHSREGGER
jgi:hypothetical protein